MSTTSGPSVPLSTGRPTVLSPIPNFAVSPMLSLSIERTLRAPYTRLRGGRKCIVKPSQAFVLPDGHERSGQIRRGRAAGEHHAQRLTEFTDPDALGFR